MREYYNHKPNKQQLHDLIDKIDIKKFNANIFLSRCECKEYTIGELIMELITENLI